MTLQTMDGEIPVANSNGILSAISNGASNGANSFAADLGAGVIHSLAYGAAVGTTAVVKGGFRALQHLATGTNPLSIPDAEEEEERSPEPLRVHPTAKAPAMPIAAGGVVEAADLGINLAHTLTLRVPL